MGKGFEEAFHQRTYMMANKHMKRYSTSLRKCKLRPQWHSTTHRIAKIKNYNTGTSEICRVQLPPGQSEYHTHTKKSHEFFLFHRAYKSYVYSIL